MFLADIGRSVMLSCLSKWKKVATVRSHRKLAAELGLATPLPYLGECDWFLIIAKFLWHGNMLEFFGALFSERLFFLSNLLVLHTSFRSNGNEWFRKKKILKREWTAQPLSVFSYSGGSQWYFRILCKLSLIFLILQLQYSFHLSMTHAPWRKIPGGLWIVSRV